MPPSLSILIPTIGRPTLARALASIPPGELPDGSEVIVAADGARAAELAAPMVQGAGPPAWLVVVEDGAHRDWGHTPRNRTMPLARGDYLLSIDDDDVYLLGGVAAVVRALSDAPEPRPHLFRLKWRGNQTLWGRKEIALQNVSTQMVAAPNVPGKLGRWGPRYAGDFDFIAGTAALWGGEVVWREEVIAEWSPPA